MKSKKTILAAAIASVVTAASSHAKLSGAYVGVSGVNAYDDTEFNNSFKGSSAAGNMSMINLGYGIEAGYNAKFDDFLFGAGLSYIYAAPNFKYISSIGEGEITAAKTSQNINGHRINLDINAGYSFEDKVSLSVGGIVSYNPGKPKYTLPGFDKKTTSDFGFGFRVGANFKLTECVSWDVSYRMTWFGTTEDYKDLIKLSKNDDAVKVSEFNRVDKMITTGIRFNF